MVREKGAGHTGGWRRAFAMGGQAHSLRTRFHRLSHDRLNAPLAKSERLDAQKHATLYIVILYIGAGLPPAGHPAFAFVAVVGVDDGYPVPTEIKANRRIYICGK